MCNSRTRLLPFRGCSCTVIVAIVIQRSKLSSRFSSPHYSNASFFSKLSSIVIGGAIISLNPRPSPLELTRCRRQSTLGAPPTIFKSAPTINPGEIWLVPRPSSCLRVLEVEGKRSDPDPAAAAAAGVVGCTVEIRRGSSRK
ncbi:hypothetical protein AXG93_2727s1160 [Marchantia polymorpha subsp. ruderalis]|uniref:Uncharacterized protein n=1 Tax=Marchantia polymorpha subsp. ruderalis TaxID=1480154 RepID=A0A176VBX7_MARPO|nr:hypothetical protein AXG93_2727s1160 [Marchantia polymorpha subsp. ruderalis]